MNSKRLMCKGVRILKGKPNLWFRPDFLTELGLFEFRATFPGRECFDFDCFENAKSVLKGQEFLEVGKVVSKADCPKKSKLPIKLWKIAKLPVKLMREKLRETSLVKLALIEMVNLTVQKNICPRLLMKLSKLPVKITTENFLKLETHSVEITELYCHYFFAKIPSN